MTLVRIYAALAVGMWLMACTGPAPDERPVLIPAPQKTIWGDGTYRLPERLQLGIADTVLIAAAGYVNEVLAPYGTVAVDRCDRGDIVLELDSAALPPEGYRLSVTHAGVRIGGGSYRGVVNGIATLRQLLPAKAGSGAKIPYAEIADRPAFGWRGVMLDVSRHFFDKEEIFTLLDQMARLKLNKFHWHLTDDQGWRIEIPCYPELTQEGAWRLFNRQDTLCMGRAAREQNDDFLLPVRRLRTDGADTLYGGYYTRKDIREVVAYAAVRGIDVIPEIDMPGHCLQAIDSYPWLACFGRGSWGQSFSSPLCVGKDRTLAFCESVWEELFELFPYEYVHMGGDEVDKSNWKRCPDCQTRMRAEGLPDEAALQAWFMHRMQRFCEARGRRMIGWDEMIDAGVSPDKAVIMWWRHDRKHQLVKALENGYRVIMTPRRPLYADFIQYGGHKVGRVWGGYNTIEDIYRFPEPIIHLTRDYEDQVMGLQFSLWTERVADAKRLDYMTFPRLVAVAESAWTPAKSKECSLFMQKLPYFLQFLGEKGIYYFNPFNPESTPEPSAPDKDDVLKNG